MAYRTMIRIGALATALCAGGSLEAQEPEPEPITTVTSDGVTIYGSAYFGELGPDTPLVLLFHQGGANGRGEYAGLTGWLNAEGFRAIAWDQRRGGSRFGQTNRTLAGLGTEPPDSYCDVYPDLRAALEYVLRQRLAERVVVWGSSYSGALVFRLAAENPDAVTGVISFSPAAGEPMAGCEARRWASDLAVPSLALRPGSEMGLEEPAEQRTILTEAGVEFLVVEQGVHGSSMLLDERTDADMTTTRHLVSGWLRRVSR